MQNAFRVIKTCRACMDCDGQHFLIRSKFFFQRLLKQREAQQREMLRAKAVLDRRAHVLAEEKEKKEV